MDAKRDAGETKDTPKHYQLRKGKRVRVPGTNVVLEGKPVKGHPGVIVTVEKQLIKETV